MTGNCFHTQVIAHTHVYRFHLPVSRLAFSKCLAGLQDYNNKSQEVPIIASLPYYEQKDRKNTKKLRELIKSLPLFYLTFFRGIKPLTSSYTRIAYTYGLRVSFDFLMKENPELNKLTMQDIAISHLNQLRVSNLEEYMEYLKYRFNEKNQEVVNKERGIMQKIASLKSFYNYLHRDEMLENNPAALVQLPKLHEKEIIRLDIDEVTLLLDEVERGDSPTKQQKAFHEKTKLRDLAMPTPLLGTGIRVSGYVGLNTSDVGFRNGGIRIHRRGGKKVTVYFGVGVEEALLDYLEERERLIPEPSHEDALFLSLQMRRISVRGMKNLVRKYTRIITPLKKITPHKLHSTYGTNLYRETGDIYPVAGVPGHTDVNTTKKHYAALEDERQRSARNTVKLREQ